MNGRSCLLNELMMSSAVTHYTHVMCVGGGAQKCGRGREEPD